MRRLLCLAAISLLVVLISAPLAWAQGREVTVTMRDNFFEPANVTVEPGTTVTWVQEGNNPHTTTSYDGLWDSGMIAGGSGESFSFTFEEPGTYDYFCRPHEQLGMVGTVTVTGGGGAQDAGAQAAGAQTMPDTGGFAPLLTVAGALLLGIGLAVAVALRRTS